MLRLNKKSDYAVHVVVFQFLFSYQRSCFHCRFLRFAVGFDISILSRMNLESLHSKVEELDVVYKAMESSSGTKSRSTISVPAITFVNLVYSFKKYKHDVSNVFNQTCT